MVGAVGHCIERSYVGGSSCGNLGKLLAHYAAPLVTFLGSCLHGSCFGESKGSIVCNARRGGVCSVGGVEQSGFSIGSGDGYRCRLFELGVARDGGSSHCVGVGLANGNNNLRGTHLCAGSNHREFGSIAGPCSGVAFVSILASSCICEVSGPVFSGSACSASELHLGNVAHSRFNGHSLTLAKTVF